MLFKLLIFLYFIQVVISQHYFLKHLSIPQDGKCAFGYGLNTLKDGSVNCYSCQILQNYFCTRCEITDYFVKCLETTLDIYQQQYSDENNNYFLHTLTQLDAQFCGEDVQNCLLEFNGENFKDYYVYNCQSSNGQELQTNGHISLQFFQYKFCINCLEQNHHIYFDEQQNQYTYICIDPNCSYNYKYGRKLLSYGKQTYQDCIYCPTQLKEYKNQYGVAYDICELQCNGNQKEIIQYDFQDNIEYPQCIQKVCDYGLNIKTISIGQKQFQYQQCKPSCYPYNTLEQNQDCGCYKDSFNVNYECIQCPFYNGQYINCNKLEQQVLEFKANYCPKCIYQIFYNDQQQQLYTKINPCFDPQYEYYMQEFYNIDYDFYRNKQNKCLQCFDTNYSPENKCCPQNCLECEISMKQNQVICTKYQDNIPEDQQIDKQSISNQEQKSKKEENNGSLTIIFISIGVFLFISAIIIIIIIKYRKKNKDKNNQNQYKEQPIKDTPLPEIQSRELFNSLKEEIQQLKSQFELIQTTSNKNYNLQKSQSTDLESLK